MNSGVPFTPLKRVVVPDLGELDCSGLVLIVGPNSSGKSQLLKDIYHSISGDRRELVVATKVEIRRPDHDTFMKSLESDGFFQPFFDDNGTRHLKPLTTYLGTGEAIGQIGYDQASTWVRGFVPEDAPTPRKRSEFLTYFGRVFVTALFLERRLIALNQVGVIDFDTQPPQTDLHALYLNDQARAELFTETVNSFGKAVWPDTSRGNFLCLRVSNQGDTPSPDDRLSPKTMAKHRAIESEGDGMKSYVATCVALLLGRRPVCLIDEPEMCLHPPQAYNLGRFIGRFGTSNSGATLVATHSSQILRGVILTTPKVQVIRLTRKGPEFHAHLVPPEVLTDILSRPTVRAEAVLDGIFSEAVAIVEADGDRTVYQAVWETLNEEYRIDIHFTAVGGTGGIADTCRLYRTLRIPVAVLADLDVITDAEKLSRVLKELVEDQTQADALEKRALVLAEELRKLPPTLSPDDANTSLSEILGMSKDWEAGDDSLVRRRIVRLAQDLDRMRRLKRGGLRALAGSLSSDLARLVTELAQIGLFLVPCGELEQWLRAEGIQASRSNKWAWANEAAQLVRSRGPQSGDIWDFMRAVGSFISNNLGETVSPETFPSPTVHK
jgi:hypothetical protein